jgi:hypothetical protein
MDTAQCVLSTILVFKRISAIRYWYHLDEFGKVHLIWRVLAQGNKVARSYQHFTNPPSMILLENDTVFAILSFHVIECNVHQERQLVL